MFLCQCRSREVELAACEAGVSRHKDRIRWRFPSPRIQGGGRGPFVVLVVSEAAGFRLSVRLSGLSGGAESAGTARNCGRRPSGVARREGN